MPDPIKALARLLPSQEKSTARTPPVKLLPPLIPFGLKSVIHGGEFLPVGQSGRPLSPEWDYEQAVELAYQANSVAYRGISAIATSAASVPWLAETSEDGDEWEPQPAHPLSEIMRKPNKHTSGQELVERMSIHLELGGNGLLKKVIVNRTLPGATSSAVLELWNMPPVGVRPIPDAQNWLSGYEFSRGSKTKLIPAEEVVHAQLVNPENPFWGMSPMQPLAKIVDADNESISWNLGSMARRAVADGVFASDGNMTPAQFDDYREMIHDQHQGVDSAHEPWVLGGGFTWQEMSRTPVEMDFVKSLGMLTERQLSGLGVPPVMAGFFDNATLANAEVSRRLFWVDFLLPFLDRIKAELNLSLVPHFGDPTRLRINYDTSGVDALREDIASKATTHLMLQKGGVPYNESAEMLQLKVSKQDEAGDEPFGIVKQSGGSAAPPSNGATPPAPSAGDEETEAAEEETEEIEEQEGEKLLLLPAGIQYKHEIKQTQAEKIDELQAIVERFKRQMRIAFGHALDLHRSKVDRQKIEDSLRREDFDSLLLAFKLDELQREYAARLGDQIDAAVTAGGEVASERISSETGNEYAWVPVLGTAWAINQATQLSAFLTETTTRGLQKVFDMWRAGTLGEDVAIAGATFESMYGLNSHQAGAVGAFLRDLGDQRSIAKTTRLARAYEFARGADIGQHQSTLGVYEGHRSLWRQAVHESVIDSVEKTWVDSDDKDVCVICISLDGQTVDADDQYFSPVTGQSYSGPGDPHGRCRCGEYFTSESIADN